MRFRIFRPVRIFNISEPDHESLSKRENSLENSLKKYFKTLDDNIKRKCYNVENLICTNNLPRSIYCPITNMPMQDPVIAPDGISYERLAIQKWFNKKKTSPSSGKVLQHTFLIPNHTLRNTISELLKVNE